MSATAESATTAASTPSTTQYRQYRFTLPPGACDLLVIRHGESAPAREDAPHELIDGHSDPPLDPVGEEQAQRLADRLAGDAIDAVYVTTLRRTAQTAAPLASRLGLTPTVVADLAEVHLGDWEGAAFRKHTIEGHPLALQMFAEQRWDAIPGGEPTADFTARVRRGVSGIAAAHPNQRVAVVVHGGVIGMMMSIASGATTFAFVGADNASISQIVVAEDRWIVRRFNDTTHLEPAPTPAPGSEHGRRRFMRRHVLIVVTAALAAAFGVSAPSAVHHSALASYSAASRPASSPQTIAAAAYARLGPKQRIGQLFMTGVPSTGASAASRASLRRAKIGNVILDGDSSAGRSAVARVTSSLRSALRFRGVRPFLSTDQEGGEVQRLTGSGFATMPSALAQGRMTPAALQAASKTWGHQLAAAGLNLNLAPVADTVPAAHAHSNAPIGAFDRELGHTPSVVATHVVPLIKGMQAGGVATTVKHFPGLGRATGNTDTTPGVTDPTTRHDSYLAPFRAGVTAGTQLVMMSSAKYPSIDPNHIAPFSTIIIASMLRGDLGFKGVVISDDLGTVALKRFTLARRATDFFGAGGTILLDTTPANLSAMIAAVTARAAASSSFAATLKTAEMTVLLAKAKAHLITS